MQLAPSLFSLPISCEVVVPHFVSSNTLKHPDKNTSNWSIFPSLCVFSVKSISCCQKEAVRYFSLL